MYNCTDKYKENNLLQKNNKIKTPINFNATLEINSKEDFLILINGNKLTRSSAINTTDGFVSMTEKVAAIDKEILKKYQEAEHLESSEEITFYDILGYDELVPNENIAELLNTKGEIKIGGVFYRVTEFGTFYFAPSQRKIVDSKLETLLTTDGRISGITIDNQTIQVADSIYLIDTYKELVPEEIDSLTYDFPELDNYEVMTTTPQSTNNFGIPGADRYPRFKSGAKTVIGKWLSNLFGDNSYKIIKLSKKRKLKGKLYDYNYGFYYEIGAVAKMRKKNWIGWSGTKADELVLGWKNVILELDPKIPNPPQHLQPVYGGTNYQNIPGFDKKGHCLTILGLDINNQQFLNAVKAGSKTLLNWLKNNISNGNQIENTEPSAIFIVSNKKVHVVIVDQEIRTYNKKSLRKVFASGVQFIFTIDLTKLPNNWQDWAKTMKNIGKLPVKSLKQGEVIVAGRLRNNWGGMIIYK